jgi:hypothetical protein
MTLPIPLHDRRADRQFRVAAAVRPAPALRGDGWTCQQPANALNAVNIRRPFNNFLNSDGYQFRLNQRAERDQQGLCRQGTLKSGAAMKALHHLRPEPGIRRVREISRLSRHPARGRPPAPRRLLGVGRITPTQVSQNNNNAGDAAANAALARGNANANLWSGIIRAAVGNALGAINFGSSYAKKPP